MSDAPITKRATSATCAVISAIFFVGFLSFCAAWVPMNWLQRMAESVGRKEAITSNRVAHLRVLGLALAVAHFGLGSLLATTLRNSCGRVLRRLWEEISSAKPVTGLAQAWHHFLHPGWLHFLSLSLVLLTSAAIRVVYINIPMDYDEAYSFLNYARRPLHLGLSDYNSTNNHLLNTLCMHIGYSSFGQKEWALRLHVFGAGIALVITTYIVGRSLQGPDLGLIAAALVGTSHVMVNYSVNARGYIWLAWMTALLLLSFWRLANKADPLIVDWFGAGCAAVLGIFAAPLMVYPILGCVAWRAFGSWRSEKPGRENLAGLGIWLAVVTLVAIWLYTPALVMRGVSAWQHPFLAPLGWTDWLSRMPASWFLAMKSWAESPAPWTIQAVFFGIGLVAMWLLHRQSFWLCMSVPLAMFLMMALQQVAPPPRIFSFLAPVFALVAGFGVVALLHCIFHNEKSVWGLEPQRCKAIATSVVACGLGIWGYHDSRREPLPGGLSPTYLVEDVREAFRSSANASAPPAADQLWRLAVEPAVSLLELDLQSVDRVLVGLPADLPFHFYAFRRGWTVPIGGHPQPNERLFLVTRENLDAPSTLRENLSLRFTEPWLLHATWQIVATGKLTIWRTYPTSDAPKDSRSD